MKYFKCGKVGHYAWSCMQNNLIQCYRCHSFGHIARNCMNVLPSQKNLIVDRLNLLKPITIDEKAVWRDKRKSVIQSVEARKQNGKEKKTSNNLCGLDEHHNENSVKPCVEDVVKRLRTLLGVVPSRWPWMKIPPAGVSWLQGEWVNLRGSSFILSCMSLLQWHMLMVDVSCRGSLIEFAWAAREFVWAELRLSVPELSFKRSSVSVTWAKFESAWVVVQGEFSFWY